MIEPTLELQRAIGERLVGSSIVTALVAPSSIVDGPRRPEEFPSIIFHAAQTVAEPLTFGRNHARVYTDLHVWTGDGGHVLAKQIVGAIREALRSPLTLQDIDLVDFSLSGARFMRDPSGNGHAVVTIEALIGWRQ